MKKIVALILAMAVLLGGCGNGGSSHSGSVPAPAGGNTPLNVEEFFKKLVSEHPDASAQQYAEAMLESPYFELYFAEKAEYYYPGFQWDFTPEGAKEAWCVSTSFGHSANVFYVFDLQEGTDVKAFEESLREHADPQWMIVDPRPDQTTVYTSGNKLFYAYYGGQILVPEGPFAAAPRELVQIFDDFVKTNPEADAMEAVGHLMAHQKFGSMYTMPVKEGTLAGFGGRGYETEIKGFEDGALLSPQISPNTFIAYVFILPEGADGEQFAAYLEDNADPAWNVCMVANTVITEVQGNKVLFMMCSE